MARLESHTYEAFVNFMENVYDVATMDLRKAEDFFTHLGVEKDTVVRYQSVQVSAIPGVDKDEYNVLVMNAGRHTITLVYNRDPGFIRVAIDERVYKAFIDKGRYWTFVPTKEFIGTFYVWNDRKTGRLCTEVAS